MYILSQDKNQIVHYGGYGLYHLSVTKKCAIIADGNDHVSPVQLGSYPDEAAAKAELARILSALGSGAETYEMN